MIQLPVTGSASSVIKKVIGRLRVQIVTRLTAQNRHQRRQDRRLVMRASSVDRQGIGLPNVLIMVDLGHQSVQNPLQELRSLRQTPLPEGEGGRKGGRKGHSRRKEEHLALQMISEVKRRMCYDFRPAQNGKLLDCNVRTLLGLSATTVHSKTSPVASQSDKS